MANGFLTVIPGAPVALIGAFMVGRLLGGLNVQLQSQNGTMTVLRDDGVELTRLQERVDSLAALLLGEEGQAPGTAAAHLRDLAELVADSAAVERRSRELRGLLQTLDNSTGTVQEFLDRQAASMREAVEVATDHLVQKLLGQDVWLVLRERLVGIGMVGPNHSDLRTAVSLARARAKAEAEVRARFEERHAKRLQAERLERLRLEERLRGENEVQMMEARARSFNDSLPFRVRWFLGSCACLLGLCLAARLLLEAVRRHMATPPLVDETSVRPLAFLPRLPRLLHWGRPPNPESEAAALAQALELFFESRGASDPCIVLAPDARASVRTMAFAVSQAARRDFALPNAVFYGPPGTGKTLTARRLARACGLDYALMSGGNVIGLCERAVPELRRVLNWAARVRSRGLVLFIDEADAFLAARSSTIHAAHGAHPTAAAAPDPFVHAAAAFFLARTGEASSQLLVVLATNRVEELDPAVVSRMSYPIEFGAPGPVELRELLEDRLERTGQLLGPQARARLSMDLSTWASPVQPWQALHARGFTGRDVQGLTDEFARQWHLREALGAAACGPDADTPGWLHRWMGLREGRAQYGRRGPARAAAAA